jgi:Protein of unknown function (DUF2511)
MRRLTIASVSVVLSLAIVACAGTTGEKSERVSRADFGDEWPLTVDSGVLSCESGGFVYFTADADGTRYAVNGFAMTKGDAPRIDAIWANDPTGVGPRQNIGPLIDRGLALCD